MRLFRRDKLPFLRLKLSAGEGSHLPSIAAFEVSGVGFSTTPDHFIMLPNYKVKILTNRCHLLGSLRPFFRLHRFITADEIAGVDASAGLIDGNDHAANAASETIAFLNTLR